MIARFPSLLLSDVPVPHWPAHPIRFKWYSMCIGTNMHAHVVSWFTKRQLKHDYLISNDCYSESYYRIVYK